MKQQHTEYWIWWITSETTGRGVRSSWRMSEADALARDPTAERVPGTMELRSTRPVRDAAALATRQAAPTTRP